MRAGNGTENELRDARFGEVYRKAVVDWQPKPAQGT